MSGVIPEPNEYLLQEIKNHFWQNVVPVGVSLNLLEPGKYVFGRCNQPGILARQLLINTFSQKT
jgi:hypothetical protein